MNRRKCHVNGCVYDINSFFIVFLNIYFFYLLMFFGLLDFLNFFNLIFFYYLDVALQIITKNLVSIIFIYTFILLIE